MKRILLRKFEILKLVGEQYSPGPEKFFTATVRAIRNKQWTTLTLNVVARTEQHAREKLEYRFGGIK